MKFEELGQDLKDEGSEIWDVGREDRKERREEGSFESGERSRTPSSDESVPLVSTSKGKGRGRPYRTRAEMLSKVYRLNLGLLGFLLISPRILTSSPSTVT